MIRCVVAPVFSSCTSSILNPESHQREPRRVAQQTLLRMQLTRSRIGLRGPKAEPCRWRPGSSDPSGYPLGHNLSRPVWPLWNLLGPSKQAAYTWMWEARSRSLLTVARVCDVLAPRGQRPNRGTERERERARAGSHITLSAASRFLEPRQNPI